jgi:hypothetical protein
VFVEKRTLIARSRLTGQYQHRQLEIMTRRIERGIAAIDARPLISTGALTSATGKRSFYLDKARARGIGKYVAIIARLGLVKNGKISLPVLSVYALR